MILEHVGKGSGGRLFEENRAHHTFLGVALGWLGADLN